MKISEVMDRTLITAINSEFKTASISPKYTTGITIFPDAELTFYDYVNKYGSLATSYLADKYANSDLSATMVAKIIVNKYWKSWVRLYEAWLYEYNPGWNVDGTETRIVETQFGKKVVNDQTKNSTSTTTNNLTDATHHISDAVTREYKNGYDNADDSPSSRTVYDGGEDSETHTGTVGTNSNAGTLETQDSGKETTTDTFTRGGNIGLTRTDELLLYTRDFANEFIFLDDIYRSINKELTIPIWED